MYAATLPPAPAPPSEAPSLQPLPLDADELYLDGIVLITDLIQQGARMWQTAEANAPDRDEHVERFGTLGARFKRWYAHAHAQGFAAIATGMNTTLRSEFEAQAAPYRTRSRPSVYSAPPPSPPWPGRPRL